MFGESGDLFPKSPKVRDLIAGECQEPAAPYDLKNPRCVHRAAHGKGVVSETTTRLYHSEAADTAF